MTRKEVMTKMTDSRAVEVLERMRIAWPLAKDEGPALDAAIARLRESPEAQAQDIGPEWKPCRKRPVIVHVREQRPGEQHVSTREGITAVKPDDLIMRGVEGEEYPIGRDLFNKTYDLVDEAQAQGGEGLPSPLNGDFDCPKAAAARTCPCGFCRALRTAPPSAPVGVEGVGYEKARELLAAAYSDAGCFSVADRLLRTAYVRDAKEVVALRAIEMALVQQPAAVDGGFIKRLADSLIAKGWEIDPDRSGTGFVELLEAVISALAEQPQPAAKVYVDFPQVGTAGPLAVVDGRVTLPDATMNDLIRHARTGYVEQPAAVDESMKADAEELALIAKEIGLDDPLSERILSVRTRVLAAAFRNAQQPAACRCMDCGGDQPGHDPHCSYMSDLHGGSDNDR